MRTFSSAADGHSTFAVIIRRYKNLEQERNTAKVNRMNKSRFLNLPVELVDRIVEELDVDAVKALRLTNRLLNKHLTSILWKHVEVDTTGDYCGAGQRFGQIHISIQPHNLDAFSIALFRHSFESGDNLFDHALASVHKITFRLRYIPSIYTSICASCALKDMIGPFSRFCVNLKKVELVAEYNDNEKPCRWLDLIFLAFADAEKTVDLSSCGWLPSIPIEKVCHPSVTRLSLNSYGSDLKEFLENEQLPSSIRALRLGSCITKIEPEILSHFFANTRTLRELFIDRLEICPYVLDWLPTSVEDLSLICPSDFQLPGEFDVKHKADLTNVESLCVDTRTAQIFKYMKLDNLKKLDLYSAFKPDSTFSRDVNCFVIENCPKLGHLNCTAECAAEIYNLIVGEQQPRQLVYHCPCERTSNLLEILRESERTENINVM